ncbi:hypothetical protein [Gordonia sp. NB41Y]|uniref:hypothetical protein n=1 Tax=Gordonia sp. NB41Y TaxID=875808 RepID=UPI00128F4860|nr:hypothetical protein [Gordonia sp. NB41Y]WLP90242.1 hypothetical protein Q9K23_22455 [Gordonia sp. NB41Y]
MSDRRNAADWVVTEGELDDLADRLAKVADIAMALAISASGHRIRREGNGGRSAPASRPPYDIGAQDILDALCNELGTTVRHMCEHRKIEVPESCSNVLGQAVWLKKNRVALATMADGRECVEALTKAINRAASASGEIERKIRWSPFEREAANRQWMTAPQIEALARKLGTDYRKLTQRRVRYIASLGRAKGWKDPDDKTAPWFYPVGDVIAAFAEMEGLAESA